MVSLIFKKTNCASRNDPENDTEFDDSKLVNFGHDYFFFEPTPLPLDSDFDDTFYDCLGVDSTPMAESANRRGFR